MKSHEQQMNEANECPSCNGPLMYHRRYAGCATKCADGKGLNEGCKGYCNCSVAGQACFCSYDCDAPSAFSARPGDAQPGKRRPSAMLGRGDRRRGRALAHVRGGKRRRRVMRG